VTGAGKSGAKLSADSRIFRQIDTGWGWLVALGVEDGVLHVLRGQWSGLGTVEDDFEDVKTDFWLLPVRHVGRVGVGAEPRDLTGLGRSCQMRHSVPRWLRTEAGGQRPLIET
jgi:hypothetical protein